MKRDFYKYILTLCCLLVMCMLMVGCSDDDDSSSSDYIIIDEEYLNISLEATDTSAPISFFARSSWTAEVNSEAQSWLSLDTTSGIGGNFTIHVNVTVNANEAARTGMVTIKCQSSSVGINVTQGGSNLQIMDPNDIPDYNKYYKPAEFSNMDMLRSDAQWSWCRYKQSEHFFVFWEDGFGDDPNASSVPAALRVDIDDLLEKAEQFYKTNIEKLGFADVGQGKSYLDLYKMEIYLLYQTEWLATGSGYDDVIGALWVNPSTCQPVGSTIAHEIGHSFQYQVYCDKLYQGATNDFSQGFRYGYVGSNGGNGFWEQCAQWQSFQDYPEEMFSTYYFDEWLANCHRHFEHEWMRYASYWLQTYWTAKHGETTLASIWKDSKEPEDAIGAYMRIYCNNDWKATSEELYDYATRMASYDIDGMREYSEGYINRYTTTLYATSDGYYQISYGNCPGTTGFNIIPLNLPESGNTVAANFVGLDPGASLASEDPGEYIKNEVVAGTRRTYNTAGNSSQKGWKYSFVAMLSDGTRQYGDVCDSETGTATFEVPANTSYLWFVVMGCPTEYAVHPWDEDETTDHQWPYKVQFVNTDLKGNFNIDTTKDPESITLSYTLNCNASDENYDLGNIDLQATEDIQKIAQAFVMQPSSISANTSTITVDTTGKPTEGKIVFGLEQPDGTMAYTYTANSGFYCTADGYLGSWGNGDPLWVEYDKDSFVLSYGHYPGKSVAGTKYTIRPALVYTKDGKQYTVTFELNMQF